MVKPSQSQDQINSDKTKGCASLTQNIPLHFIKNATNCATHHGIWQKPRVNVMLQSLLLGNSKKRGFFTEIVRRLFLL